MLLLGKSYTTQLTVCFVCQDKIIHPSSCFCQEKLVLIPSSGFCQDKIILSSSYVCQYKLRVLLSSCFSLNIFIVLYYTVYSVFFQDKIIHFSLCVYCRISSYSEEANTSPKLMLLPAQKYTPQLAVHFCQDELILIPRSCFNQDKIIFPSPCVCQNQLSLLPALAARTRSYTLAHASTRISSSSSQAHASAWINLYSVSGSIMDKIISLISCVYQNKFIVLPSTRFCEDKLRLPSSCFCQDKLKLKTLQYASARTRVYYSQLRLLSGQKHTTPRSGFCQDKSILLLAQASVRTRLYFVTHAPARISSESSQAHASA